jgi:N-methylhydantoinase B
VHELLEDRGMDDLGALSRAIQGLAEGSMREAIRAAKPGTYTNALELDGYDEPLTIRAAVTIAGDQVTVDFAGTSPQIGRGINCVMNYTYAYTCFALKCLLDPLTRKNEGSFRPFVIRAPEGCLVNPRFPAPVNGRQIVGHLVVCALFGALATGFPDRVIADSGSAPTCRIVFSGRHPSGDKVSFVLFANGGMGARPDRDGLSTTPFPTNSVCAAIEVMENLAPLIVWKKELLADSGGAGEWRGGLGQEISLECVGSDPLVMSVFSDRRDHPALGFFGGRPGNPIRFILNDGGTVHPKAKSVLRPGDRLTIQYAGGGGFGPPERRGRDQVLADLRSGYITGAAAREVYRIVPDEIPDGRG